MNDSLAGKVAIVTGGSRGIGRAVALRLARDGATVVINYSSSETEAQAVVAEITERGGKALSIQADIASVPAIRHLFSDAIARCGRLDVLVANAGYACFKPLCDITEEDFDRTFNLNARGTFFCLQEAARHLQDHGRIIGISTIGTVHNLEGGACYFGSKGALEQFCRVLAKEVAPRGITVNVVSPGFTATQMLLDSLDDTTRAQLLAMTPLGRLGEPADLAEVIGFLASPAARWITRQNLPVDGGIISR